ncbi:DMT family transporter [Brachybacterium hainanense]|uniref:DMT family transporter n=1 Tax=Brachybacterium hainanense TaxID=1541174 RepID=A0ABV6RFS5_9MICO
MGPGIRSRATVALVLVTAIWGSTFFLIKGAVAAYDPVDFLAIRFAIAALIMGALFHRRLRGLGRRAWRDGLVLGFVYGLAQVAQTWGLRITDASISGFVTGTYVIITPLLMWLLWRRPIGRGMWAAVILAFAGLAVLSLTGFSADAGALITLVSAIIYAVHIILLEKPSQRMDATALATIQIFGIALTCGILAIPGGIELPASGEVWGAILYTAVIAGIVTMTLQTWAQGHLSPTRTAVIMTLEPVFASTFAVLFSDESLTARLLLGGALILAAMVVGVLTDTPGEDPASGGPGTGAPRGAASAGDAPITEEADPPGRPPGRDAPEPAV